MKERTTKNIKKLVMASMCLALCLVLPMVTGRIPQIGRALSPMHIPVLLCGFICGYQYGIGVGLIAPILSSLLFQMPPIYPMAVSMSVELAVYGCAAGLLYKMLPKKNLYIYVTLIIAMITGRVAFGIMMAALSSFSANIQYSFKMFINGSFVTALPGIILHIVVIPVLVIALKKAGLMENE